MASLRILPLLFFGSIYWSSPSPLSAQTQNQIAGSGYAIPVPVGAAAPGQVLTLFVSGLNVPDATASGTPLPRTLSGIAINVNTQIPNYPTSLPIFSVVTYDYCSGRTGTSCPLTQVTVQIPTEQTCFPNGFPNPCMVAPTISLSVHSSGTAGQSFVFNITGSQPHIVNGCDTIFGNKGGSCYSLVTHADGTFVGDAGYPNGPPAKPGETITFYAVGLGQTNPVVGTGQAAPASPPAVVAPASLPLVVSYRLSLPAASPAPPVVWAPVGRWIYPSYVGLVPGYVGLYQINVALPPELAQAQALPGSANCPVTARIAVGAGGLGPAGGVSSVDVCVQP